MKKVNSWLGNHGEDSDHSLETPLNVGEILSGAR